MRDKDSQLIFESYRKRVILNEAAPALVFPAIETITMTVGGTAAVLVIGNQIAKTYQLLTGQEQQAMKTSLNSLNSILEKKDYSARGCYELINFIKSNSTDEELINFAESQKQVLMMANDLDKNMSWDQETLKAYVDSAESANNQLINFVTRKKVQKKPSKINISAEGDAADALAAGLGGLMNGSGGGGPQPPPQPPNKGGGWFAKILAVIGKITAAAFNQVRQLVQGVTWKFLAIAATLAVIYDPELAGELTKRIVGATGSAAKEGAKEVEQQIKGGETSKTTPSPATGKYPVGKRVKPDQQTPDKKTEPAPAKSKSKYALENLD